MAAAVVVVGEHCWSFVEGSGCLVSYSSCSPAKGFLCEWASIQRRHDDRILGQCARLAIEFQRRVREFREVSSNCNQCILVRRTLLLSF